MTKSLRWLLPALFLYLFAFSAGAAHGAPLKDVTCTGTAGTVAKVFAIPAEKLECGVGRFNLGQRFERASVDLTRIKTLPYGRMVWHSSTGSFDSMLIRLRYADGSMRMIDVDPQMTARNWDANGTFFVPLPQGSVKLTALDVVVERPQTLNVLRGMGISDVEGMVRANYNRTLLYVFILGLLCIPVIYNLFFYRVLREQFIAWHVVMTIGTALFVLFNSGLINLFWPYLTILQRFGMTFLTSTLIMVGASEFSCRIIEQGKCWPKAARFLPFINVTAIIVALVVMLDIEALRLKLPGIFALVALPVLVIVGATIGHALYKGSRAARYLLAAFSGILATSLCQLCVTWGLLLPSETLADAMYISLVLLVLGTAAGVVDRFVIIKYERDRARIAARKLGVMATSDGLTGLLNRRAFDRHRRLPRGHVLLLADLDRFKSVNDEHGHQVGDAVLIRSARIIEKVIAERCAGKVYRLGGEEFAVVCELADGHDAVMLAEAVRLAVAADGAQVGETARLPRVTVSIGAVSGRGQPMHQAMTSADEALYRAKKSGRNCCVVDPCED